VETAAINDHWTEDDWDALVLNIEAKRCTPFLGAGAAVPALPLGREVAERWALKYDYPFEDSANLARVAQYVAVRYKDSYYPKKTIADEIIDRKSSGLGDRDLHRILARLDLPLYLTTNYDDFMHQALLREDRPAIREHCRWNEQGPRKPKRRSFVPSSETPVVYHLHGVAEDPASIVITEEDYLTFLVKTSENPELIPPQISEAFSERSLLFLGYALQDITFLVLFRRFADFFKRSNGQHFAVQIDPATNPKQGQAQRAYLRKQLEGNQVRVFWGTCEEFCLELRKRCESR
jgi:hypothetical protein